jgi:hypothetical protein
MHDAVYAECNKETQIPVVTDAKIGVFPGFLLPIFYFSKMGRQTH